jgi:hypothetical protein
MCPGTDGYQVQIPQNSVARENSYFVTKMTLFIVDLIVDKLRANKYSIFKYVIKKFVII